MFPNVPTISALQTAFLSHSSLASDRLSMDEQTHFRDVTTTLLRLSVPCGSTLQEMEYRATMLDHCLMLGICSRRLSAEEAEGFAAIYFDCSLYEIAERLYGEALDLLRKTNGDRHVRTIRAGALLGHTQIKSGKHSEAGETLSAVAEIVMSQLGETLSAVSQIGMSHLGVDHALTLETQSQPAFYTYLTKHHVKAEELLKRSLSAQGETHPDTLSVMKLLGFIYHHLGRSLEAEGLLQRTIKLMSSMDGDKHLDILYTKQGLAQVYMDMGRIDEAVNTQRSVVEGLSRLLGSSHETTLHATMLLAQIIRKQGRLLEAEAILRELMQEKKKLLGDRHLETAGSISGLALVLSDAGKFEEADMMFKEVVQLLGQTLGTDHRRTLQLRSLWSENIIRQGRFTEAQEALEDVLDKQASASSIASSNVALTEERLGYTYLKLERGEDGTRMLQRAVKKLGTAFGEDHAETLRCMGFLAGGLRCSGRVNEAEEVEREIVARREPRFRAKRGEPAEPVFD